MTEPLTFIDIIKKHYRDEPEAPSFDLTAPPMPDDPAWVRRCSRYAHDALDGAVDELSRHEEGSRNAELNNQALKFYRWSLAGHVDADAVTQGLRNAALACGLEVPEIDATLRSAWRGAQRYGPDHPRPVERSLDALTGTPVPAVSILDEEGRTVDPNTGEVVEAEDRSALIRATFPALDWHALWADESEEEWIVEPLLPARRLVALYSAPKLGKSLLMLEIAAAVASGRPVLGVAIEAPRHVLYIDFENDPKADIRQRLQDMGYGPGDLERLHYLSFPTLAGLDSARGGVELMAAVHEYGCEVVMVDTVSRAIQGEENENDTWLAFYRNTGLLLKQAGVSLVRLDHSGKDETKGQRGGSAKSGDVDAVWRLSRVTDDTYRLDCEAARMPVAEKVLVLHRELYPLRHRVDGEGRAAAWRVRVESCMAQLDALSVPLEHGRDKCREALKTAGQRAENAVLAEAIKRRQPRVAEDE